MQNHIWVMIAIHVRETQRDRNQVIAVPVVLTIMQQDKAEAHWEKPRLQIGSLYGRLLGLH